MRSNYEPSNIFPPNKRRALYLLYKNQIFQNNHVNTASFPRLGDNMLSADYVLISHFHSRLQLQLEPTSTEAHYLKPGLPLSRVQREASSIGLKAKISRRLCFKSLRATFPASFIPVHFYLDFPCQSYYRGLLSPQRIPLVFASFRDPTLSYFRRIFALLMKERN